MVDAEQFLRVSQGLKQALGTVEATEMRDDQRVRWGRRLAGITEIAQRDLGQAERQLASFRSDWSRVRGRERRAGRG